MSYFQTYRTFLSALVASGFMFVFMAQLDTPYLTHVSGYEKFEEGVFKKIGAQKRLEALKEEKLVKYQIAKVLSRFNTGLAVGEILEFPELILNESKKYGYDPFFLMALILTESSFDNWARSNRGALGLMQIKPRTGHALASETRIAWRGKPSLHDPEVNIALGAYYLNKMYMRFGDLGLALEAYNHGPSQLSRYIKNGKRPGDYSRKIFSNYNWIKSYLNGPAKGTLIVSHQKKRYIS